MIRILFIEDLNDLDYTRVSAALGWANQAINTPTFAERIPLAVVEKLRASVSIIVAIENPPWYKWFSKEIARESNGRVVLNRRKFGGLKLSELAGTLAHEATHTLGYTHAFWSSKERDESIPYKVGGCVAAIVRVLTEVRRAKETAPAL